MKKDKSLPISKAKMSSSILETNLEKKFQTVTNTQDSIQTLSLWLMHHKAHHQKIVASWMKVLQKAKISHRLTLFYLANDVVQNSKRKNFLHFANSFAEVLREATLLVRDDSIRPSVLRVFNIWEQRNVYKPEFIAELRAILANNKVPASAPLKLLAQFKPDTVIEKIRSVSKLDIDVNKRMTSINLSKLKATDAEIVQQFKDRHHGQQFKLEFDENATRLEELIKLMEKEIAERTELILLLEQSEIYYDTQKGEAKIVANAYKNFGGRVEKLQKKLEEISFSLPSPLPSPTVDAPSPTTSDQELELKLPSENQNKGMTSWLDVFASGKEPPKVLPEKKEIKSNDSSSLESRLSSFMQNNPALPAGLHNTLFGNTPSTSNASLGETVDSGLNIKKEKEPSSFAGILTPVKDDYSGQNTPLQDEDTSSHSFFSKLASSNKTHSSKDILKGLTNLIQSASADKDDSQKKDKFSSFSSDIFEPQSGMSTFIKSIIPSVSKSPQISSPLAYFSNNLSTSSSVATRTISGNHTATVNSYQTAPFNCIPSYSSHSSNPNEHRSFIPSLVPSTPQEKFPYTPQTFPSDEYNPEMEIFDSDMDLVNPDESSNLEVPSPEQDALSPVAEDPAMDLPRPVTGRRLSTLITLVTDDTLEKSLPENNTVSGDIYRNNKENYVERNPPWLSAPSPLTKVVDSVLAPEMANSPNEEYFIGKQPDPHMSAFYTSAPPPLPPIMSPPNGPNTMYLNTNTAASEAPFSEVSPINGPNNIYSDPTTNASEVPISMMSPPSGPNNIYLNPITTASDAPLSRIETVQSHRDDLNGRWFNDNNWSNNLRPSFPSPPSFRQGPPNGQFFNNRNFSPRHFQPRQNWPNRRPDFHQKRNHSFSPRPYGPPQNKRFPFRGRGGWNRNPQY